MGFVWFLGSWILHLKISGLCFGSPVPGMWVYVLSLVGLLVALFVGFGCCVACWFCMYVVIPYRADAFFLGFLGEVLSVWFSFR